MKIDDILAQERRARMAAERLLAQKQAELSQANKQLSLHARNLSEEIVETREVIEETRTENSLVKADLERATQESMIAKRRLWDSLETIEDGFAVFDRNECMIAANSAYLKPFDGLECIAPGVTYIEILQAALDEGVIDIEGMRPLAWRDMMLARWRAPEIKPHTLRLWDGTYIKLVDRRSGDGDTVSLGLNITDTIKYEEKLKDARAKAEAASRAKSAFLANMSHEIRTPMNGVVAIADLLAEGTLDDEQRLYVETIKKSGEALLTIINDVLDYSKIEAAKLALHPEEFDLEAKIHDVVTLLLPSVHEKGLDLSIDFDLFMPTKIKGDPVRIGQILTNLLGNAVKFTSRGHVLIRVLGLPVDDGKKMRIHFTVEDSGIGIPTDMQDHIFGEFNQVDNDRNRKFDGTGLGLAITRQLVELMDGEIWVDSEEGHGSCFGLHVTLPVVEEVQIPSLPLGLRHALLVMEAGLQNEILEKNLKALGLEVTQHARFDELPAHLDQQQIVFIQENLPNGVCDAVLNGMKAANSAAQVILLSSPNVTGQPGSAQHAQINRTLHLPILRRELFKILQDIDLSVPHDLAEERVARPSLQDETAVAINNLITPKSEYTPTDTPPVNPPAPEVDFNFASTRNSDPVSFMPNADEDEIVFAHPQDTSPQPQQVTTSDLTPPPLPPAEIDLNEQKNLSEEASPVATSTEQAPFTSEPYPAQSNELRTMRVLAAEDNRTNQLVFSKLVKSLDIDLKFAGNGREALELYDTFRPDLVFMDISMPEMDGKEATQCIRALEQEQGLPPTTIVALTAHAMSGDAEEILAHGLDRHLTKPLKKPLILQEILAACPQNARPPLPEDQSI